MMKRSKSLVALLLVLCMAMTFVVPATFAATETISFDFGNSDAAGQYRASAATVPASPILLSGTAAHTNNAYLLNCNSGRGFNIAGSVVSFRSNATKWWFAVKLCDIKAGTYDLTLSATLKEASSNGGGKALVYFVTEDAYNAAFVSTGASADIGSLAVDKNSSNVELVDAVKGSAAASFTVGGDYTQTSWSKTDINIPADGNYVMIFRTSVAGAIDLSGLEMTREVADPAVAKIGDTPYPTLAAALEAAQSGDEIDLAADIADAGDFTIGSGVTLDLNGKNLSAGTIAVSPSGVLKDSASTGILTATVEATGDNGGWLPLTNGNGKTLYKVNTTSLGRAAVDAASAKFAFNVHFENEAAYALVEGDLIKVAMIWDGATENTYANSPEFVNGWATSKNGGDNNKDIVVTVSGLDSVEGFKLTPVVAVNGVTINLATIAL